MIIVEEDMKPDICKVEKILKGSLASIPSPSVKIMSGKVSLKCKGKTIFTQSEGDEIESRLSSEIFSTLPRTTLSEFY